MDVARAGVGQLLEVLHPVRAGVGEGEILARVLGRGVRDREVADLQLLDLGVPQRHGGGLPQSGPALRRECRGVEVDDEAAGGVRGQGGGVRVGDLVGDDLLDGGRPHLHHIAVRLAGPLRGAGDGPDAGPVVAPHRDVLPVEFQGDGLRGGSPDGEGGTAVGEDRTERRGARALPVQVVEHTRALYAGRGEQSAVGGALGGDQLAAQRLADPVPVTRVDGERRVVLEVRVLRLLGIGERGRGEPQPPALVRERSVDDGDPAVLRVDELLAGGVAGLHLPYDGAGVDPLCLGLREVGVGTPPVCGSR